MILQNYRAVNVNKTSIQLDRCWNLESLKDECDQNVNKNFTNKTTTLINIRNKMRPGYCCVRTYSLWILFILESLYNHHNALKPKNNPVVMIVPLWVSISNDSSDSAYRPEKNIKPTTIVSSRTILEKWFVFRWNCCIALTHSRSRGNSMISFIGLACALPTATQTNFVLKYLRWSDLLFLPRLFFFFAMAEPTFVSFFSLVLRTAILRSFNSSSGMEWLAPVKLNNVCSYLATP